MPLDPAPIQNPTVYQGGTATQVWVRWFSAVKEMIDGILDSIADIIIDIADHETRIDELESVHGWAFYDDSQYTIGAQLSIPSGRTQLTIDALGASNNTAFLPSGQSWWSGNKITPGGVGDSYIIRLDFIATPGGTSDTFTLELEIDTGNLVFDHTYEMNKGIGTPHRFSVTIPIYTLNTFSANGGKFYISTTDSFTVYNIGMLISRLSKA